MTGRMAGDFCFFLKGMDGSKEEFPPSFGCMVKNSFHLHLLKLKSVLWYH